MAENEQVEILKLIWGEMKALNQCTEGVSQRVDGVSQRVDGVRAELVTVRTELKGEIAATRAELKADLDVVRRRRTETEIRLASAVTDLAGETRSLSSLIRDWREEHRADRADLRERVKRIEAHLGLPQ